jgi:5-methylcytosine-specific restriction protein A
MANKSRKYCASYQCNHFAASGSAYCHEHQPARAPKETDAFYLSVRWRRFRHWYLSKHPLCELCECEGRGAVAAAMVDHVLEIQDGGELTSEENAQSLCHRCHNIKTAMTKYHRKSVKYNRMGSQENTYIG